MNIQLADWPIVFGNNLPFVLLAGPCVIESRDHALYMAESLKKIADSVGVPFIYKSSFDKANRTSISGFRGISFDDCLSIFEEIRSFVPVMTDVHTPEQCELVSSVVDIIQIPAFLSRQTDLLLAAGRTKKCINVKKGQFMAPWDMQHVVHKIASTGNESVLVCERGVSFGYNTLIVDMRSLPIMAEITKKPVVFDATHSVQKPSSGVSCSSGERQFAPALARAAIAVGVSAIFAEIHDDPDHAPSDGPNMLHLKEFQDILHSLKILDEARKSMKVCYNDYYY